MSKEEIKKELQNNYDKDSGGTSSTTCARAREKICFAETREEVRDRYREAVGYEMQPFVERMVMDYIGRGMEIEVVEHAIEVTGWALRPSAHYLRAILRRYEEQNIWTMTAVRWDEVKRSNEQDLFRRT